MSIDLTAHQHRLLQQARNCSANTVELLEDSQRADADALVAIGLGEVIDGVFYINAAGHTASFLWPELGEPTLTGRPQ